MATACVLTIGNELVSGDVPNTNASWIAKRLAPLGVETRLIAAVPDEIETIAEFIRREAPLVDFLVVTGGLGGTPSGVGRRTYRTRESVIVRALVEASERWPSVLVGSYPSFGDDGPTVEVVVKSSDAAELDAASGWLAAALEERS